jgi:anti-sigma regulatory factor (Ser/Thr protein kinase)
VTLPSDTAKRPETFEHGHDLVSHRPATLERRFAATDEAPFEARRSLDPLARALDRDLLDVVRLLVSELVANAVRHGSSPVTLRLLLFPTTIAAVVEDAGPGLAAPPPVPRDDDVDGWGLHLVSELADSFGVETSPRNAVWFELERARSA